MTDADEPVARLSAAQAGKRWRIISPGIFPGGGAWRACPGYRPANGGKPV